MRLATCQIQGGVEIENQDATLVNRTGAALTKGDIVALNLDFSATSGQAMVGLDPSVSTNSSAGYILGAAVAVTTENASRFLGVALSDIADDASGRFRFAGLVEVEMNGANAGEFLHGTNAQTYATPLTKTELDSVTAPTKITGIALEATSGAQVKRALWDGLNGLSFVGGGG